MTFLLLHFAMTSSETTYTTTPIELIDEKLIFQYVSGPIFPLYEISDPYTFRSNDGGFDSFVDISTGYNVVAALGSQGSGASE